MNTELRQELEKLSAWTRPDGCYIFADSTTQSECWNALVQAGYVDTLHGEGMTQYRITVAGMGAL